MVAQRQKTINLAKDLAASQREVQFELEMPGIALIASTWMASNSLWSVKHMCDPSQQTNQTKQNVTVP